jgi:hypothetical protein
MLLLLSLMKTWLKHPLMLLPATLTEANARLDKQLEESAQALKEVKALLKKEISDRVARKSLAPSVANYCWTHGYKIARNHTRMNCMFPKTGHKKEATKSDNMGGSQANKERWGPHLKIIAKSLKTVVPHPFYKIMTLL